MSINLMSAVFAAIELTSTEKLILLAMTDFANDDGLSVYPSIETLSKKTALAERTIQRVIQGLQERGIVEVVIQGNGRYHTNEYRIYKGKLKIEKGDTETRKGDRQYTKGDRVSIKGDTESPDPSLTIIESSLPPVDNDENQKPDGKNIFTLYESTIGLITQNIVDDLKDAEKEYPLEWIEKAFKIAAENNARNWRYVRRVLENMKNKGVDWKPKQVYKKRDEQKPSRKPTGV